MTAFDAPFTSGDRDIFAEFDIEPADLAYLRSVDETLTPEIQEWIVAQWRAEVETLHWFEKLRLSPDEVAALFGTLASFLRRLLSGDRVEELYAEVGHATLVALQHGVRNTDVFQASTKLESVLTAVSLQLFPGSDQQTVALVALSKFLKSLLYVVMETYRREAADEIERRNRDLSEALDQQTATAEVLGVINSSPGDLQPVFEAILDKAHALCDATRGTLFLYDSGKFKAAAAHGYPEDVAERLRAGIDASNPDFAPLLAGNRVHIPDLSQADTPVARIVSQRGAVRTNLLVPLIRDGVLLGMISCNRTEVRPFSDKEIALIENFAAQAVIAIENARLINETREALEQQTATAEVLQVINASPGNVQPVFDVMLEKALSLCEANLGLLYRYDIDAIHLLALRGELNAPPETAWKPVAIEPNSAVGQLAAGTAGFIHNPDITDDEIYRAGTPSRLKLVEVTGARTALWIALRKDEQLIGVFIVYRKEVRPFSDRQIALLENFAAQAVIAMENARLLDEIRQRQAELRVTFDNMADGVVMFDAELRLAAWNRNFQEIVDLPDDFLTEPHGFDDYIRYLAQRGEFGEVDPDAEIARLRQRFGDHYSFERTRPDGTIIEVRHNPMPEGGFVLIYSDITERKRSDAEIRAARDAAEAALRDLRAAQANLVQAEKMASLGQLTAGIAHEIKNPLNFVNNFASLSVELLDELKETTAPAMAALDEDKRADADDTMQLLTGNLEKIAEHGRRADNIVKSMLEHSRGVSGERREVDLNGVIEEALNLAYHGARAQDQSFNITLERDYASALIPIELAPQEITRVFLNLFGNGFYAAAKRARENGDRSFRPVLAVATREAGDAVEVRVRDNGTGIPPEIKDKLFQPFFTTKPTGEGTGLGLSISYDIVTQQHGGTITVESEPGGFTEFTVRLPRH
jgi:two-component system NtrC family sensor kinase